MDTLDLRIVDQYDDGGQLLRDRLGGKTPAVFETAVNLSDVTVKHPSDYAVFVKTASGLAAKFPLMDAGNTAASLLYFVSCGMHLPEELRKEASAKLETALDAFGLPAYNEMEKIASPIDILTSAAADDHALAALFELETDPSIEHLRDEFAGCSPRGKQRLAFMVKEAGVDLDTVPELKDYAGTEVGQNLSMAIDARKLATGWSPEPSKVLDTLKEKTASGEFTAEEAVASLELFDSTLQLTQYYGRSIPDPVYSIYGAPYEGHTKTASVNVSIGGRDYSGDDIVSFAQGAGSRLEGEFGAEFAQQFAADPVSVLGSLPDPHKAVIAGMMDAP
jgi:hypothetical protein